MIDTPQKAVRNEYRITRNRSYSDPNCFGFKDLSARNGHYIVATCEIEARMIMNDRYPYDYGDFSVQLWKENV